MIVRVAPIVEEQRVRQRDSVLTYTDFERQVVEVALHTANL